MSLDRNDLDVQNLPLPASIGRNAFSCHLHRSAGQMLINPKAYAPPGAADYFSNLFQFTGLVELKALYGVFTSAGDTTDGPANCYFTIDDGAAAVTLTAGAPHAGGVNCTNAIVGTTIAKVEAMAIAATYLEGSQCRSFELTTGGSARSFFSALIQSKPTVATNYIRFNYTMAAAANVFTISWVAIWACRHPGSTLISV